MTVIPPADSDPEDTLAASDAEIGMVRSEERVRSRIESVGYERVRVQKYVVTEERTITVSVRREEIRIVREPIARPALVDNRSRSEAALVIVLSEERPVVSMRVVPVERVTVSTRRMSGAQDETVELRKERVALEKS